MCGPDNKPIFPCPRATLRRTGTPILDLLRFVNRSYPKEWKTLSSPNFIIGDTQLLENRVPLFVVENARQTGKKFRFESVRTKIPR